MLLVSLLAVMLLYMVLLLSGAYAAWSELPELLSSQEGSLETLDLGLPGVGHVVALGHFSSQRRLDCVLVDESRTQVFIYRMAIIKEGRYYKAEMVAEVPKGQRIVNVVMSDFNRDGFPDLLVMHQSQSKKDGDEPMALSLFLGNGEETLRESGWNLPLCQGQPQPVDWGGNMRLDLLGVPAKSKSKNLYLWKALAQSSDGIATNYGDPISLEQFGLPSMPHWSAQADFNGDGLADLLIMTSTSALREADSLQIWLRNPKPSGAFPYEKMMTKKLPRGTGPLTVADVDGDGHLDIIFSVCYPKDTCSTENSLHIMYNIQKRFCSSHRKYADCVSSENLFKGNTFDFNDDPEHEDHMVIQLKSLFKNQNVRIMSIDPHSGDPVSLAVGDVDFDSYPELAFVVKDQDNPSGYVALLRNVACSRSNDLCTASQTEKERRSFVHITGPQVEALTSIKNVVSVGFADWFGIGPPGFIVNTYDHGLKSPRHVAIRNGIAGDSFSMRVEALNGVKASNSAERPYGVNFIGPSLRCSFVDSFGATQVRSGTQLGQVLNHALQYPTVMFGLGSTSNFVQRLEVGIFRSELRIDPRHSITNVIPNSEVIFVPPYADNVSWRAELQINPGDYMFYVLVSVASALLVLAVLTGIFKWQEKREDDEERRKATHLINFDAL